MRKAGMISLGLMLVLFAGLFVGLGAAETTESGPSTRGTGPIIAPERSSADEIGTSPAVKLAEVLNSTAMKQGYFVPVAETSATGRPGFEYYDPVSRSACFDSEGTYVLHSGTNESVALFSSFVGSSAASLTGLDPINTRVTRIIGRNESNWVKPQGYQSIQWADLWSGVDLVYTGVPGGLKSQFWFDRDSDYQSIAINISGAQALEVSADGSELTILTSAGNVTESAWAWEQGGGRKIGVSYSVSDMIVSFDIDEEAEWDAIVLDPLLYSTFIGGTEDEWGYDIVADSNGYAYITGTTLSTDFPTTPGAYNTTYGGDGVGILIGDVIVAKINNTGSNLIYSTYIGGSGGEEGWSINIDDAGKAYITGLTDSVDFPVTVGSFNETPGGNYDAFVLRLSADGSALDFSGLLGGSSMDWGNDLMLDPTTGDVLIAGITFGDFPTTPGAYMTSHPGGTSSFVSRISSDGTTLLNSTYYGSSGSEDWIAFAVNSTGFVYLTGCSSGSDFPAVGTPYNDTNSGGYDVFYAILSGNLSVLHLAGYIGGSADEKTVSIALTDDRVVFTAYSYSDDYPTTSGVFNESRWGSQDIVISVLNERLDTLNASTYIGGSSGDVPYGVVLDVDYNVYVGGSTSSTDFPMSQWAYQNVTGGYNDAIMVRLTYDLQELIYSTYLGGTSDDRCYGIAILNASQAWERDAFVTGRTESSNFPTTGGAFNQTHSGNKDIFVSVIEYHPRLVIQDVSYQYSIEYHKNWTVYANVTAINDVSTVEFRYNDSVYLMSNASTPESWNYSVSIHTMMPGANSFTIWADGTLGNYTETGSNTFYIGNTPQYASISAPSTVFPATPWTVKARVTDELIGDSGVAGVHFRLDSGDWEPMAAEGDVYTADSRSFSEEGTHYWQLRAIDSVGNIAYSSSFKLIVSEETLPTTAAAAVVTTANGTPPWVDDYKADWGWWVYSFVFGAGILMFALLFGKEENNATVNALIIILTATAAGIMAAASLAGISRVFEWPIVAALWGAVGVWALVVAKKKLPAFAAGLALGSGALGVEMLISSGWNLAVTMYVFLAAAAGLWAADSHAEFVPKRPLSTSIIVGVLMAVAGILGLWYVFV